MVMGGEGSSHTASEAPGDLREELLSSSEVTAWSQPEVTGMVGAEQTLAPLLPTE